MFPLSKRSLHTGGRRRASYPCLRRYVNISLAVFMILSTRRLPPTFFFSPDLVYYSRLSIRWRIFMSSILESHRISHYFSFASYVISSFPFTLKYICRSSSHGRKTGTNLADFRAKLHQREQRTSR